MCTLIHVRQLGTNTWLYNCGSVIECSIQSASVRKTKEILLFKSNKPFLRIKWCIICYSLFLWCVPSGYPSTCHWLPPMFQWCLLSLDALATQRHQPDPTRPQLSFYVHMVVLDFQGIWPPKIIPDPNSLFKADFSCSMPPADWGLYPFLAPDPVC